MWCTNFVLVVSVPPPLFFAGIENNLDSLNQLKVKGLILGPIHTVQADQLQTLNLEAIDPVLGTNEDLESLLERAHKKGGVP